MVASGGIEIPYWKTILGEREALAAAAAVRAGYLSHGATLEAFERRLEEVLGVKHVACTVNGTLALYLALVASGIGPGDEVLVPNRTFIAGAHAVRMTGATPRLVEVTADRALLDVDAIRSAITPRTRAVIPTHLNGRAVDMPRLLAISREAGLLVVEDAAQALCSELDGRSLGTFGDFGCFSLGVTKFITTGQGGLVATNDDAAYERVLRFQNHGVESTFDSQYVVPGSNLKFNAILAAIGLAQLENLPDKKRRYEAIYALYCERLAAVPHISILENRVAAGELPVWVEALLEDRPAFVTAMKRRGIQVRPFLPDLASTAWLGADPSAFPASQPFARDGVQLPCGPGTTLETVNRVCDEIAGVFLHPPVAASIHV